MPQSADKASYQKAAFLGKALAVNDDNFAEDFQWLPKVVSKTSAYTVKANESGTIFNTEGATAGVTFTLPAADDGPWLFFFHAVEDFEMLIAAETADTMIAFNDVAADSVAYTTASEHVGGGFIVYSGGGSTVYALALPYGLGATAQTVTVAT